MSSRFLSFVLRHRPEKIGLELDAGGWADIDELLVKAAEHGVRMSRAKLEVIVANNDKQRFAISADGQRIRANQGHSFPVDLGLAPVTPPPFLYHGTVVRFLDAIQSEGLHKRKRHHVHLSPDWETAVKVGQRHGQPVVLKIRAQQMHQDGHTFFLTANNVWLTDHVPPRYFEVDEE